MLIGRVKGNVVSTNKTPCLDGLKLLLVLPVDLETLEERDEPMVAIDGVGAGEGELVLCVAGSSSRQAPETKHTPSDLAILAISRYIGHQGQARL